MQQRKNQELIEVDSTGASECNSELTVVQRHSVNNYDDAVEDGGK